MANADVNKSAGRQTRRTKSKPAAKAKPSAPDADDLVHVVEDVAHTVEDMAHKVEDMAQSAVEAGETMAESGVDIYRDHLHFLAEQLNRDIAVQERLLTCRNPAELVQIQLEYGRDAAQHYAGHYQNLMRRTFEVMAGGAGPLAMLGSASGFGK
ncbi:MAG: phasin family protein [Pseudomonadota bacterium]